MMAGHVHLSHYHFARVFKSLIGETSNQYVLKRKIEKSKHLLIYTKLTLAGIASEFGFNDLSHYWRTFRKYEGMTPAEFQRSNS